MSDRAVANLPSRDFDITERFYGGFGFHTEYRDRSWLMLRRGELRLEFFPAPDLMPSESSFMCSIRIGDVDDLYRAIRLAGVVESESGFPRLHSVRAQEWGGRAGFLIDPDGTQLNLLENTHDR